jgi:hypothetical protein
VKESPALIDFTVPKSAGIEVCPKLLSPQQRAIPRLFIVQVWFLPALIETLIPRFFGFEYFQSPQH